MNGTIIDPSVFYWMGVADTANKVLLLVTIITAVATVISLIIHFVDIEIDGYNHKETKVKVARFVVISAICCAASTLVLIFIPAKETIIEMLIAKTATYENAQLTVDAIKDIVDYIIEALKTLS